MRAFVVAAVALAALALAGRAAAASRGKSINFGATTVVHNSGGLDYAGTVRSHKLGNGSVRYTNTESGDEIHTTYVVRLKSGSLKSTATSMAIPGTQPTTPPRTWARARSPAARGRTRAPRARSGSTARATPTGRSR